VQGLAVAAGVGDRGSVERQEKRSGERGRWRRGPPPKEGGGGAGGHRRHHQVRRASGVLLPAAAVPRSTATTRGRGSGPGG